jgi:hypothetical protein
VNIAKETARIRARWSDATRRRRAGTSIPHWTAPTISTGTLLDAARERIEDEQQEFQMPEVERRSRQNIMS